MSSLAALPSLKTDSLSWSENLSAPAAELKKALQNVDPDAFAEAVVRESQHRLSAFAGGITRYNQALQSVPSTPYDGADVVWQQGTTRLLDYGPVDKKARSGRPVLVVPSLINRAYILDLEPGRSFLRSLAQQGFRPFLVDWDAPGDAERAFTLTDYIAGRLAGALDVVTAAAGGPVPVIGYCMGGTLSVPLAQIAADQVASLALLAAPWDFSAMSAAPMTLLKANRQLFDAVIDAQGELPVDVLQAMFTSLAPTSGFQKFAAFAKMDADTEKARTFVRMEEWLNDGVPLAAAVAKECLHDWYGRNLPGRALWRVAGERVEPRRIQCPALVVTPERDVIVPAPCAQPLSHRLADARTVTLPAGHVGMVAGRQGPKHLLPVLTDWLTG